MLNKTQEMIKGCQHVASLHSNGRTFELQCLESLDAIDAFEDQWKALEIINSEASSCFQTFQWCREYHKQYSADMSDRHNPLPQIFVLRENSKPVMIWPLMKINSRTGLALLTCATEPLGKYSAILHDPTTIDETIGKRALEEMIAYSDVDCVSINHYPNDSMVDKIIGESGYRENSEIASLRLDLTAYKSWNDFSGSKTFGNTAETDYTHKVYDQTSEEFQTLVDWMIDCKIETLESNAQTPGILSEKRTKAMLQGLGVRDSKDSHFTEKPKALVHTLYADTKLVAAEIGILYMAEYIAYLSACSPEFSKTKAEQKLLNSTQKWAFDQSLKSIDFTKDASEIQKTASNQSAPLKSTNLPITFKGKLYAVAWKTHVRPKLQTVLKRLK